jgi:hypothetical protein
MHTFTRAWRVFDLIFVPKDLDSESEMVAQVITMAVYVVQCVSQY